MERYLTRKARPFLILVIVEVLVVLALAIWCAASVDVLIHQYLDDFGWAEASAFLVLLVLPFLVMLAIVRLWFVRGRARKLARALAGETKDRVAWPNFVCHADMRNAQAALTKLCEKKYLRNVQPDHEGVTLCRDDSSGNGVPNGGKCPMCGAVLEKRIFGDWACRYCGTVAGRS